MQPVAHAPSSAVALAGSRSQEQLSYRGLSIEVAIQDQHGRSATLSFQHEELAFRGTYDRYGAVVGSDSGEPANELVERLRSYVGDEAARQAQARGFGAVVVEREEVSLHAERTQLTVTGDADLVRDYFGVAETADRIFSFAEGLLQRAGIGAGDAGFGDALSEVRRGIRAGFAQAADLLGGVLPEISQRTQQVLETMLAQVLADPTGERPSASDVLAQLLADEDASEER